MRSLCILAGIVFASVVFASTACGPAAQRCRSDDDCARAVCVDGGCVERGIGETTDDPLDPSPDRPRDLSRFALERELRARVVAPDETAPLPEEPEPRPPALNDGDDEDDLPLSCLDYLQENEGAISGFYAIRGLDGAVVVVECDMETAGGGWTIVADISRDGCPAGWTSTSLGCDRDGLEQLATAFFPIPVDYTQARGRARARSSGENNAFDVGIVYEGAVADSLYVDGLALTVINDDDDDDDDDDGGAERSHLWTFAAGGPEPYATTACPSLGGTDPPSDVVGAYSCDVPRPFTYELWDGDEGDDDGGVFTLDSPPKGSVIEARIMSPMLGVQSRVRITSLTIALR